MTKNRNQGKAERTPLAEFINGSDENNLAEFPLALLSDFAPPNQKTVEFQDTLTDWATGKKITRRVCVTGSDKFGLPTAKDEQVLMALIQLTGIVNNFTNPEVPFTKHQIIELLRWENSGWAYDRVEESLHRWKDVSVHYWNAWRDHESGSWTDSEAIGVIDYVKISDGRRNQRADNRSFQSRFVWNRQYFKSFAAKYMKPLDFGFYCSLRLPAAQRAYRFLDKRFHHRPDWEFDLHTFACEKLGFSRNYDTGQLKARLRPAMVELEQAGFIKPVSFRKNRPKMWSVFVSKKGTKRSEPETLLIASPSLLVEQLVAKGVAKAAAEALVKEFPAEQVDEKIQYVDWLIARKDKRAPANAPGFLVAAIRGNYPLPRDYLKAKQRTTPPVSRKANTQPRATQRTDVEVRDDLAATLSGLNATEREALEREAVADAHPVERASLDRLRKGGGKLYANLLDELLRRYLRKSSKSD